jgi:hypothetical protein
MAPRLKAEFYVHQILPLHLKLRLERLRLAELRSDIERSKRGERQGSDGKSSAGQAHEEAAHMAVDSTRAA